MEELYAEGVAIHGGPESCVGAREGAGEALTGARVGRAIEPRNHQFGVPTPSPWWKATRPVALCESLAGPARSKNHGVYGTSRWVRSTCEAGEQSRGSGCGAGGGKAPSQGEHGR